MDLFEKHLLNLGLENYRKSGSSYSEIQPKNSQELLDFTNAANYLFKNNWLTPHSDNILANSVSIVPNETLICYELTNEGLLQANAVETT